jgi:heme/copper-type cytochrome/quinol oxidase subunit 2
MKEKTQLHIIWWLIVAINLAILAVIVFGQYPYK